MILSPLLAPLARIFDGSGSHNPPAPIAAAKPVSEEKAQTGVCYEGLLFIYTGDMDSDGPLKETVERICDTPPSPLRHKVYVVTSAQEPAVPSFLTAQPTT